MKNKLVLACTLATLAGTASLGETAGLKVNEQGGESNGNGECLYRTGR